MEAVNRKDFFKYWNKFFPEIEDDIENNINNLYFKTTGHNCDEELDKIFTDLNEKFDDCKIMAKVFSFNKLKDFDEIHKKIKKEIMYYNFYKPFINIFSNNLKKEISKMRILHDCDEIIIGSLKCLLNKICNIGGKTLIFETQIAKINSSLKGNTEKERFNYFNDVMLSNEVYLKSFYKEYKELITTLYIKTINLSNYFVEVINNINYIKKEIKNVLDIDISKDKIVAIEIAAGDDHNNGKSVATIKLSNSKKFIYKPRSMKIEEGFQNLIKYINKNNNSLLSLKTMKMINKDSYGITEFIEYNECNQDIEIQNYYKRIGQFLAILHSLNGVDVHYENLIANGEHPILIDLESLFHNNIDEEKEIKNIDSLAKKEIMSSVQRIGLLPFYIKNSNLDGSKVDISGLGGNRPQMSPFKNYKIVNRNSDNIKLEFDYQEMKVEKNNPLINGKRINALDYTSEIIENFEKTYKWIIENKKNYKMQVIKNFKGVINRVLIRDTRLYANLLRTSYHPDLLRDKLTREILLSRIAIGRDLEKQTVINEEFIQLLKGDIPYFSGNIDSKSIFTSNKEIPNYFLETPMDTVLKKILDMSDVDLNRQIQYIKSTFSSKQMDYYKDITNLNINNVNRNMTINKETWLELAKSIAEYITSQSIVNKDEKVCRTWVSPKVDNESDGSITVEPVGRDIYLGEAGIALFLMYYGKVSKDYKYYKVAKEALRPSMDFIYTLDKNNPYSIGGYEGLGGRVYAISKLYELTKDNELLICIEEYLNVMDKLINCDNLLDIIGGSSGALLALISLENISFSKDLKKYILYLRDKCASHIINKSIKSGDKRTWVMASDKEKKEYTGFAHGNCGIISALALNSVGNDFINNIDSILLEILNTEDSYYIDELSNWYTNSKSQSTSFGWCHGAPGILLSKLLLLKANKSNLVNLKKLNVALNTTRNKSLGNNTTLCHGDLGNLEILYFASKILNDVELKKDCERAFQWLVDNVLVKRWKGNSFRGTDNLAMMIGLCGYGYSVLKFYDFDQIPSILYLE